MFFFLQELFIFIKNVIIPTTEINLKHISNVACVDSVLFH